MVLLLTCIANIKKILWQRNLLGPKTVASTSGFHIFGANLKKTGWQTCAVGILVPALCEREILSTHSLSVILERQSAWLVFYLTFYINILTNISTNGLFCSMAQKRRKASTTKNFLNVFSQAANSLAFVLDISRREESTGSTFD